MRAEGRNAPRRGSAANVPSLSLGFMQTSQNLFFKKSNYMSQKYDKGLLRVLPQQDAYLAVPDWGPPLVQESSGFVFLVKAGFF